MTFKKVAIDYGHNCPYDNGAVGFREENKMICEVGDILMPLLNEAGIETVFVTPDYANSKNDSLKQRVYAANKTDCDFYVSLHFNASIKHNAYGSEVYYRSNQGKKVAQRVQTELCKLGFYDRKIKQANYYVLRETKMPAILVEGCFCDHKRDIGLFNPEKIANAIADGLLDRGQSDRIADKLIVRHDTWIKGSVYDSSKLSRVTTTKKLRESEKFLLSKGVYTIKTIQAEEEGHYLVTLKSGLKGFAYLGHVDLE